MLPVDARHSDLLLDDPAPVGIPVSTIHTITGAVIGVGAARRISAVQWGVARNIVVAWVVTLLASALMAIACYWLASLVIH